MSQTRRRSLKVTRSKEHIANCTLQSQGTVSLLPLFGRRGRGRETEGGRGRGREREGERGRGREREGDD